MSNLDPSLLRAELADQFLAGTAKSSDNRGREPLDVVGVLVYALGLSCFLIGPIVYFVDIVLL